MTFLPKTASFARPLAQLSRRRRPLTPEEHTERRVRRRLLRFIVETHRRREAERGLSDTSNGGGA